MDDDTRYRRVIDLVDSYQRCKDETQLQAAFRLLDLNGDGLLSLEEWMSFSRAAEEEDQDEEHINLFRMADSNGDGCIDEQEYIAMVVTLTLTFAPGAVQSDIILTPQESEFEQLLRAYRRLHTVELLESLFALVDTARKGFVSKEDLQRSSLVSRAPNRPLAVRKLLQDAQLGDQLSKEQFGELLKNL